MWVARIGDELEAAFHRIAAAEMHRLRLEQQLQVAADLFIFLVRNRQHNDPAFSLLSLCVPWILSLCRMCLWKAGRHTQGLQIAVAMQEKRSAG